MRATSFFATLFDSYFIAAGVLLGGAFIGGLSAFITGKPPLTEIFRLGNTLKIWAIVAAIGGTFDAVSTFEKGLFEGETKIIVKQFIIILAALGGAQTSSIIIAWFTQEHVQ